MNPQRFFILVTVLILLFVLAIAAIILPFFPPFLRLGLPLFMLGVGLFLCGRSAYYTWRALHALPEPIELRLTEHDRHRIAVHESGHAIVTTAICHGKTVERVQIGVTGKQTWTGRMIGRTVGPVFTNNLCTTRKEFLNAICALLGGRAAEELVFTDVSDGAGDDLQRVTEILNAMVRRTGMSRMFPNQIFVEDIAPYSEYAATFLDLEISGEIAAAYFRASAILAVNRTVLDQLARALFEQHELDGERLNAFLAQVVTEDAMFASSHAN